MPALNPEVIRREYQGAKTDRSPYEAEWALGARLALPRQYGGWQSPDSNPGAIQGARSFNLDTTAGRAVPKYVAILNRIATPDGYDWHGLEASDKALMRIKAVDVYFEELAGCLFRHRRDPRARWTIERQSTYAQLAVYGPAPIFTSERKATQTDRGGPLYRSCALRDIFVTLNEDGSLRGVYRRMRPNARQARDIFGEDALPKPIRDELARAQPDESKRFEIVHYCGPQTDHDPGALDGRRFPIASAYVLIDGDPVFVGDVSGFYVMPYRLPMIHPDSDTPYGYSPMQVVMSSALGVNAMKRTVLKQGQKAADPVLLAADDGVLSGEVSLIPGRVNYGAIDANGRARIQALPVGDFQIAKELIQDERADINDAFLVTLFQILVEHPEMTAAEVWERAGKEAALVAPAMGMLQSMDLGPCIEREIDILTRNGLAPEMPPELIEARGEYSVIYTSPMAKSQKIESVSAYSRLRSEAANIAQLTGDTAPLRRFNDDVFIPEAADIMSIPGRWLRSDDELAAMQERAEQRDDIDQLSKAAPAIAGLMKAGGGNAAGSGKAAR